MERIKALDKSCELVWDKCLSLIKDNVSPKSFETWFIPINPIKLDGSVLTIRVPSAFFYEWLEEHYVNLLRKTIKSVLGADGRLEYNIVVEHSAKEPSTINVSNTHNRDIRNQPVSAPMTIGSSVRNPFTVPGLKKINIDSQLNPNYSFDNYVEGDCNRLARSAGYAVAKKPGGTSFNPLMIYGATGLGKSHLIQAIGAEIKKNFPDKLVLYIDASKFTQQYVDSIKEGKANDFVNFYQMMDVLIVDDVHHLSNRQKTQDVFFNIFNQLHQSGKQIILTSDKPPIEILGLEPRLLSRFKWGLTTDITTPDIETRIAIINKKMEADGTMLPNDVVEYLAHNIDSNMRDLEGAIVSLLAQSTLNRKEIDLPLAKQMLKNFVKQSNKEITIEYIQKIVSEYFELPSDMLKSKSRKRELVQARQISMYLAKSYTKASLKAIGSHFGGRDHSTVIYACQTVDDLMETDKKFRAYVSDILKKIKVS
jgi:chromosomal replication initiator protein